MVVASPVILVRNRFQRGAIEPAPSLVREPAYAISGGVNSDFRFMTPQGRVIIRRKGSWRGFYLGYRSHHGGSVPSLIHHHL